jgi:TolB-like protein/Flp pilus assembly protein TadD
MLAVLPFENLGPPEDEYFTDGITEEIMSRLAGIHELGIIARTSAMQYKKTSKSIQQIGEELGVDYILEGTVRWQRPSEGPSKVRVTPQLIKVSDATHLWSEPYDAVLADIFQVQSNIAQRVMKALDIALGELQHRDLESKPTESLEAYDFYLRGTDYYNRSFDEEDWRIAVQMFEKAIELDPRFALAIAELSMTHSALYHFSYDRTAERLAKAKAMVDQALELQPELPEAHLALGYYYYWCHREYDLALKEFAIAEKDLPNETRILEAVAYVQRRQGDFEEALNNLKRALELNPRDVGLFIEIAETNQRLRRYEEAERYCNRSISLAPDQLTGYIYKANNYIRWQGDTKRARAVLEVMPKKSDDASILAWFSQEVLERNYKAALEWLDSVSVEFIENQELFFPKALWAGNVYRFMEESELARASYDSARIQLESKVKEIPDDNRIHSALGIAYAGLGRKEEAIREGKLGVELFQVSKDALIGARRVMDLALIYIMVGEYEAALEQLDYLLSIPSNISTSLLQISPWFDPLRDHPRYQKLLEKYK